MNYDKNFPRVIELYRELHQVPGVGFDLDETVAIVKAELNALGIKHTEKYGKGSIVAELGQGEKCIALRADMDALPIQEESGVPFSSKKDGIMHACGHDSHTAILLGVARCLKEIEDSLKVRVRLIFQPSEEGAVSGAKMMVDNGVMDGVDHILTTHCEAKMNAFEVGMKVGEYMAACIPMTINFYGRSAHAALPSEGIDAIAMANEAYAELKAAIKEEAGNAPYIWSVGKFSGGTVHNIICDNCEMAISFRFYDMDLASRMEKRTFEICNRIANAYGGSVEIDWHMSTGAIINDPQIIEDAREVAKSLELTNNNLPPRMSSEDFGWYLTKAPGAIFRYGVYDKEYDSGYVAHTCKFKIYEPAMKTALRMFVEYIKRVNEKEKN